MINKYKTLIQKRNPELLKESVEGGCNWIKNKSFDANKLLEERVLNIVANIRNKEEEQTLSIIISKGTLNKDTKNNKNNKISELN